MDRTQTGEPDRAPTVPEFPNCKGKEKVEEELYSVWKGKRSGGFRNSTELVEELEADEHCQQAEKEISGVD